MIAALKREMLLEQPREGIQLLPFQSSAYFYADKHGW
jgi:hypothetical protein